MDPKKYRELSITSPFPLSIGLSVSGHRMDSSDEAPEERRKRRRRRLKPSPVSAKLTLDERVKGNVGAVSHKLFAQLFERQPESDDRDKVQYISITPWQPPSVELEEDCSWTIVAVKLEETSTASASLRFPASCLALQSFAVTLQSSNVDGKIKDGVQVLVLDVQPLPLETVFIKVDGEALRKHEEVQKKFGGGFLSAQQNGHVGKGKGKGKASMLRNRSSVGERQIGEGSDVEDRLKAAVRESLASPLIVHVNDQLPLPLPSHPITHVPFPPIKIILCEPVDQGLMVGSTRIVIDMASKTKPKSSLLKNGERSGPLRQTTPEEEEDTSAEQFYSALESDEITNEDGNREKTTSHDETSTAEDSNSDGDSLSDDSSDNMISLNSPALPTQTSGVMSSKTAATPRPFWTKPSGINTPGSVYSSFTATTARQRGAVGRPFQLKPLLEKVPDFLLHPRPHADEDDESRIFVDVKMLVRLGCFSGEWVKLSVPPKADDGKDQLWPLGAFGDDEYIEEYRVAKIYGLVGAGVGDVIQYPKTTFARRQSQSSVIPTPRSVPSAFISPILFANLGRPANIILAPLSLSQQNDKKFSRSKLPSSAIPPVAKEITLVRIPTPLTTERTVQAGLFANLKHHFESKRRILREGDLVAVSVDAGASRMFSDTSHSTELDSELEELLLSSPTDPYTEKAELSVAWFKVGQISGSIPSDSHHGVDPEIWGGVSSIEPMTTRMVQIGSRQEKILSTSEVPWQYYLGIKRCPKTIPRIPSSLPTPESLPQHPITFTRRRIRELLAASASSLAAHLNLKPLVLLLHSTHRSIGKSASASLACADLGLHLFSVNSYEILTDGPGGGDVKTEASLRARIERALTCGAMFTVPLIEHVEALTADRMASTIEDILGDVRALIMTTTEIEKVSENIRSLVTHEIEFSAPDEREREGILGTIIDSRALKLAYDVDLAAVAVKTAALVAGDLVEVVERAVSVRQDRLHSIALTHDETLVRDVLVAGGTTARCITKADFEIAVEAVRKNFADAIGAPKIPNVTWKDVGGLANVKDAVMETIQLPLEKPELFAKGMKKRSGILFYGPPGTGKTLLAKAIATEFSLNFFSVKGPELLNMYIGESEANVRQVFQRARDARPCVVFFDELDSVAPKRGNQGDSGGVMDRIVSQLLAELDGMSDGSGEGVFVIGATNRPDLLDQALLRPGRFDKMLYLGVSDTHEKQLTILEALTRKFSLHPETSLRRVASSLPFTYTGADLYALCSDAMLKAVMRQAEAVDAKIKARPGSPVSTAYFFDHLAKEDDLAVTVTEEDFLSAQRELVGSVSAKELEHYQRVRQSFESSAPSSQPHPKGSEAVNNTKPRPPLPHSTSSRVSQSKQAARAVKKGKGKATQWSSEEEEDNHHEKSDDDDDDDAYVTSNDFGTPQKHRLMNGGPEGKGKGKGTAPRGFGSDGEDDLYCD